MATHSTILAWTIPSREESGEATVHWVAKEVDTTERLNNRYVKSKCILTNSQIFIIFIKFINIFQG